MRGLDLGVGYGVSIRRQAQKCPEYGGLGIASVRLSPLSLQTWWTLKGSQIAAHSDTCVAVHMKSGKMGRMRMSKNHVDRNQFVTWLDKRAISVWDLTPRSG